MTHNEIFEVAKVAAGLYLEFNNKRIMVDVLSSHSSGLTSEQASLMVEAIDAHEDRREES